MAARALSLRVVFSVACSACASRAPVAVVPAVPLAGEHDVIDARVLAAEAPYSVFVFFSADCHCLEQHDPRLVALDAAFRPRGVRFYAIDSEVRASPDRDAQEARRRGYGFPILVDRGGNLAGALGAEYATYSVVVDHDGRIRYRGGLDSDKTHLHDDARPYLRDALEDLLSGREPRLAEAKTLGCALQRW